MRLVASGFLQIFCVQLLDHRVFMRFPQGQILILVIQGFGAQCFQVSEIADAGRLNRLAAAVDASAGTAHHFNKVVICFSILDLFQKFIPYDKNGVTRKIWFEEDKSIEEKLKVVVDNNTAGIDVYKRQVQNGK